MPIFKDFTFADTRTSIQKFMDSAQSIEFSRADLVATSLSRSGRVITQTRNTVKPWVFKVTPVPYMSWLQYRDEIEQLFIKDRHTEHEIKLGGNAGSAWLSAYQGALATDISLGRVTVTSIAGNTLTLGVTNVTTSGVLFKAGDIIQFNGVGSDNLAYRYPYVVVEQVNFTVGDTSKTVILNRGYIIQANFNPVGKTLLTGNQCSWRVIVTSLPAVRYLPGKLVEFTDNVGLLEIVI